MLQPEWWLGADNFMRPTYRISPFSTASMTENRHAQAAKCTETWFDSRFPGMRFNWTMRGSEAITLALKNLLLGSDDWVTILTTTGNHYVSGCVTRSIENVCKWNRQVNTQTAAILVIHEFGSFHQDMQKIYSLGVPVIEDYAHCFCTSSPITSQADYIVFSLPKFIPVQYGGILLSKTEGQNRSAISEGRIQYLEQVVSNAIPQFPTWCNARVTNFNWLSHYFSQFGCTARFKWEQGEIPSVFMFNTPEDIKLPQLKQFMQNAGIESSIFYGEQAFFIPVHHKLNADDLEYFAFVWRTYLQQQGTLSYAH